MLIRKLFTFSGLHIVRDCSSERCKKSIHGHTYTVEVKLESNYVDHGQMVVDFGLLKGTVKDVIKSWDRTYAMWDKEDDEYKNLITSNFTRHITMPVSPSAEMLSLTFYAIIKKLLERTVFNNGEKNVKLHSVVVHETATGYAESFEQDYINIWIPNFGLEQIIISDEIKREWQYPNMWDILTDKVSGMFIMPEIKSKYPHELKMLGDVTSIPVALGGFSYDSATQGVDWEQLPEYVKNQILASTESTVISETL